MNLKIIGTTHLDKETDIINIIKSEKPDILGVELCDFRAKVILDETLLITKEEKKIASNMNLESKSLLDKMIDKIKQKAEQENMDYGSDQKTVLRYANEKKIPLVLVDMPILKIQELFSKIPINEQQEFTQGLLEFENETITKQVDEEEVLSNLKKKCPIAFEFLINMRNLYISNQILKAINKNPHKKIVIFLGKAHVQLVNKLMEVK